MAEKLINSRTAANILGYKNLRVFNANRKQNKEYPKPKALAEDNKSFLYSRDEIEAYAKIKANHDAKIKKREPTPEIQPGIDNEMAYGFVIRPRLPFR